MGAKSNCLGYPDLNSGQIQCMLLVREHLTSKEIAQRLGISPHTVDQRVRQVLRLTGAVSRREAAKIVRHGLELGAQDRESIKLGEPAKKGDNAQIATRRRTGLMLPFSTHEGQINTMGIGQRVFWIIAIAAGGSASTAMYLAGLESLSRLVRSH